MELKLEDLSLEDRRALKHNHPLLDDYAARVNAANGLPDHTLNALKNAGEKSESVGKMSVSPKGAQGVMQFMPSTAKRFNLTDPTDPVASIDAAGRYAAQISKTLNTQDPGLIAAGYNAGENRSSLKAGRVPAIPETQGYVERVRGFLTNQPALAKPAAVGQFSMEDLDPADAAALSKAPKGGPSPLSDSNFKNYAAAVGKSISDTGRGSMQLLADAVVNPVSQLLVKRDLMDNRRAAQAEADALDKPLMDSKAGLAGYASGTALLTALPASALSKAKSVQKVADMAAKIPTIGRAAQVAVPAAVAGGGLSALSPVAQEGDRSSNMAMGAAIGPLAALVGSGVGKLANTTVGVDVIQGVKALTPRIDNWLLKPSFDKVLTPTANSAVQAALKADVPVYASQLRNPGAELTRGRAAAQRSDYDRAIARTFGQDTDDLAQAFPDGKERMSSVYRSLFDSKTIPLDKSHMADLAAVSKFNNSRSPRFQANPEVDDLVQRATAAATDKPSMSGQDYQSILQQYKTLMTQFGRSTDVKPADHHAMQAVGQLIDSLNKQAGKVLSKEEQALFRTTNKQWRNMTQLEALAPRSADGNISPKQLAAMLARKRKGEFIYGQGDQELPDLARYGSTYMGLTANAPKGLMQSIKKTVRDGAPYAAATLGEGAVIGSYAADHEPGDGALSKLSPYIAGVAAAALINRGAANAMNPRLTRKDMAKPRGALGEVASRVQPAPTAAMTVNTLESEE